MKKIKVFLGGYINLTNAQNLNCFALAKHLDKSRFDVYTLEIYSGNLPSKPIDGVNVFRCFYPHKISKYLGCLWGIWKCDVAYLPKRELPLWEAFLLRLFGKKSFTTVEGIFDEQNLVSALEQRGSYEKFIDAFNYFDKIFSITAYLKEFNFNNHHLQSEEKVLYLGTETKIFLNEKKHSASLKNIVFIGRLKKRKGVFDIMKLAQAFPELQFHLVGDGEEKQEIERLVDVTHIKNVKLLGTLDHTELSSLLAKMDLHVFPSRSEGFPKVTLETAAAGVPSLVYSDYGAKEWITDHKDGFVVDTLDEMKHVIEELLRNPELLQSTSQNAVALAKRFDWKVLVKEWEEVIIQIVKGA